MRPTLALVALLIAGCGGGPASPWVGTSTGTVSANGLFGPKVPADRPLTADERDGDFDRFLAVAKKDAVRWHANAVLCGAQATNVDAQGKKAGGTTFSYTFTAEGHAIAIAVTGNNVAFEKAKAAPPMDTAGLVPAAKAIAAAMATKQLETETFVLGLAQPKGAPVPVYIVAELKHGGGAKVLVNARTGEALSAK